MKNSNKTIRLMTLSIACMLLSACASQPSPTNTSSLDKMIDDAFQGSQQSNATPEQKMSDDEVASALLPDINLSSPGAGSIDVEPRFDITVNRANI